ncbi:MAG: hypothetical protein HQL32_11195 [Planctomycetes bacterium]|nr:hypothetical protein [Planctomycetota bacterium]
MIIDFGSNSLRYDLVSKTMSDGTKPKKDINILEVFDKEDGAIDVRLLIDEPCYELFLENGSVYNLGQRLDSGEPLGSIRISMEGAKGAIEHLVIHKMKFIWKDAPKNVVYPY